MKEAVANKRPIKIGHLSANIDGDSRYTDTLNVEYNPTSDTISVTVSSTGAAGGMDGPGGATAPRYEHNWQSQPGAKAADVVAEIRCVTSNGKWNFQRYGKPTKRFTWLLLEENDKGLSLRQCELSLKKARTPEEPAAD